MPSPENTNMMVIGIIVVSIPLCIGAYVAYRLGTARVEGPDDPPQERSTTTGGIVYSGSFNPVHAGHLAVLRHMVQIPCTLLPGTLLLCALLPCTLLPCTLLPCTLLLCALLPCTLLFCTLLPCTLLPCALLLCALFQALHVTTSKSAALPHPAHQLQIWNTSMPLVAAGLCWLLLAEPVLGASGAAQPQPHRVCCNWRESKQSQCTPPLPVIPPLPATASGSVVQWFRSVTLAVTAVCRTGCCCSCHTVVVCHTAFRYML